MVKVRLSGGSRPFRSEMNNIIQVNNIQSDQGFDLAKKATFFCDFGGFTTSNEIVQYVSSGGGGPLVETPAKGGRTALWHSNASTNAKAGWKNGNAGMVFLDSTETVMECGLRVAMNINVGVQERIIRNGLLSSITDESANCVYIRNIPGVANWQLVTRASNVETSLDSGIVVTAGVDYKLKIVATTSKVDFYMSLYGQPLALVGTITTNIPTGGLFPGGRGHKTLGDTVQSKLILDYYLLEMFVDR